MNPLIQSVYSRTVPDTRLEATLDDATGAVALVFTRTIDEGTIGLRLMVSPLAQAEMPADEMLDDIQETALDLIDRAVAKVRSGEVKIPPGQIVDAGRVLRMAETSAYRAALAEVDRLEREYVEADIADEESALKRLKDAVKELIARVAGKGTHSRGDGEKK
jgi:hypothetical protein